MCSSDLKIPREQLLLLARAMDLIMLHVGRDGLKKTLIETLGVEKAFRKKDSQLITFLERQMPVLGLEGQETVPDTEVGMKSVRLDAVSKGCLSLKRTSLYPGLYSSVGRVKKHVSEAVDFRLHPLKPYIQEETLRQCARERRNSLSESRVT